MALWLKKVLKRPTNNRRAAVKGKHIPNRGADYGLEIPCEHCYMYILQEMNSHDSMQWLQSNLEEQGFL